MKSLTRRRFHCLYSPWSAPGLRRKGRQIMKLVFTRKEAATIWIGAVLSTALLFSSAGNAMHISQYDKMDKHDQAQYVTLLIKARTTTCQRMGNRRRQNEFSIF